MTGRDVHDGKCRSVVLLIVGPHSSGKSTLARSVARKIGGTTVEMGHVVRQEAHLRQQTNLVQLADEILDVDALYIARKALALIGRHQNAPVIVVGPRTQPEFDFLTSRLPGILTVGLQADANLRHARWRRRHLRFTDTWEEREGREAKWGTAELVQQCRLIMAAREQPPRKLASIMALVECGSRS